MKLIVGLGNPGKKYAKTRHNMGFVILEKLKEELSDAAAPKNKGSSWELSDKFNAEICRVKKGQTDIILAKPMTYMNNSGEAVGLLAHFYKLQPSDIIVTHDDKDLPLGAVRVQTDRGDAGHNGVASVISHLGTKEFTRARVGIANASQKNKLDTATFVLKKFGLLERRAAEQAVNRATQEILKLI